MAHGVIRGEFWRVHRSPRSAANGMAYFRYDETFLAHEAERLARIILEELTKTAGHPIPWKEFPALQSRTSAPDGIPTSQGL